MFRIWTWWIKWEVSCHISSQAYMERDFHPIRSTMYNMYTIKPLPHGWMPVGIAVTRVGRLQSLCFSETHEVTGAVTVYLCVYVCIGTITIMWDSQVILSSFSSPPFIWKPAQKTLCSRKGWKEVIEKPRITVFNTGLLIRSRWPMHPH